jgi:hypothetical protein
MRLCISFYHAQEVTEDRKVCGLGCGTSLLQEGNKKIV